MASNRAARRALDRIRPLDCVLVLTHELQPEQAEYRDRTAVGWTAILEGLAKVVG